MEQRILKFLQEFLNEIKQLEALFLKQKEFSNKKISFIAKFQPTIILSNHLAMQLVELIETYDKLVATLKFLHLAGCFDSDEIYFGNVRHYQKMINQVLAALVLTTTH